MQHTGYVFSSILVNTYVELLGSMKSLLVWCIALVSMLYKNYSLASSPGHSHGNGLRMRLLFPSLVCVVVTHTRNPEFELEVGGGGWRVWY
jgi:hypothetical protein